MNQRDGLVDQHVQSQIINLVKIVRGKDGVVINDRPVSPDRDSVSSLCDDIADECQRIKEIQASLGYN
jgi:hypothetical protein